MMQAVETSACCARFRVLSAASFSPVGLPGKKYRKEALLCKACESAARIAGFTL